MRGGHEGRNASELTHQMKMLDRVPVSPELMRQVRRESVLFVCFL